MEDGYTTPIEQIINNLTLQCPNAPKRPIVRHEFQEPIKYKTALPLVRPTKGGLTLKGYSSPVSSKK
jgi:hypothetical protein